MKISKLSRRRQAARAYKCWSVKFLAMMFPVQYVTIGREGMRRVIADCRPSDVSDKESRVLYDRSFCRLSGVSDKESRVLYGSSFCEKGRKLALTQHIVRRRK